MSLHILYCPYYFDTRCDHNIYMPSDTNYVDSTMNHIMNNTPWVTLASFFIACFEKRNKFLENLENYN